MSIEWFGQLLEELPHDYERVIPPPGKRLVFTCSGYVVGFKVVHIKPGYTPREKVAIGLDIDRIDKPDHIHKWCVIGAEPVANLEAELAGRGPGDVVYTMELRGQAPGQHWLIGAIPAQGA